MAERLRLKTQAGKGKVRLNIAALVAIVVISLVVGYVVGNKGLIAGSDVKGAIPASEFQYFLDKYNQLQEDYQGCVADAWALQLACKLSTSQAKDVIANVNIANTSINSSS